MSRRMAACVVLAMLAWPAAARAETEEAGEQAFAARRVEVVAGAHGDGAYRILYGAGDPLTQARFAELAGRLDDAAAIRDDQALHRGRAWAWTAAGVALLVLAVSAPVWASAAYDAHPGRVAYPVLFGGLAGAGVWGWLAWRDFDYLAANEDSVAPRDPYYGYEDARRIAADYNARLRRELGLAGGAGFDAPRHDFGATMGWRF